ncbi:2-dehydro-3-deoxygalactonokinase [Alphaproteobacteria bacterium KMM 3653]|uniref:2-dehydro-3-deoxygalactonokinase n=1 Tax=Harenicola maris TaxID=2841044 RepID=A0AAP2G8C3_9RHOB|nr:2-dehydro-3-deoxygalactonokinase [Harenicola maris]
MTQELPDWIAVDWGTTHLRVWLMSRGGRVLDKRVSEAGMGGLAPSEFEPALLETIGAALPEGQPVPVVICGMAGSRQGWTEAPYCAVPCAPPGIAEAVRVGAQDMRIDARILPGVKQTAPADVMRGEETQIAGFLALNSDFDGVICLPGTHTKWAHISAGEIVSFQTFMTGELFALLCDHSVLRHSVVDGWDAESFSAALSDAMAKPEALAARLFSLRAEGLLDGLSGEKARARLSGLLIGAELAAARPYWLGQQVAVIGDSGITAAYRAGLEAQGVPVTIADAERLTLEGLKSAFAELKAQD